MKSVTRRSVLVQVAASAVGGAVLSAQAAQAQTKIAQKSVAYRPKPNGDQKCSNCVLFIKPNACQRVAGDISPDGYCILYRKA